MRITQQRERHTVVEYRLGFQDVADPAYGYSFKCDEHGAIDLLDLLDKPAAEANYIKCIAGIRAGTILPRGKETYTHTYITPKMGVCCDTEFELSSFTNWCPDCDQPYNSAGQALSRNYQQWGEETGEHWTECI